MAILGPILEATTARYSGSLVKEDGTTAVAAADLDTLKLTLYADNGAQTIINSRNEQDVLNTNGVTVSAGGALVWILTPADNIILDDTLHYETHVALFEWTYAGGDRAGKHEVRIRVLNLQQVSQLDP